MAAQPWTAFKHAKRNLGLANIDLSGGFRIAFFKSAAVEPSAGASASTWASLSADGVAWMASAGDYSKSGIALAGEAWTLSGNNGKWDVADVSLLANGVDHSIKGAVIYESGGTLLCFSTLSASEFAVSNGNTLTITIATSGVFTLS